MRESAPDPDLFEEHRSLLFSIAYRMLGTVMDAQDLVQETFVRWQRASRHEIESPEAWLTTVLTRLCINHLKLARVQRETYFGEWLPEPLVEEVNHPVEDTPLTDSLSLAFLVLLETLTPTERAVFILREGLAYEFSEIASVIHKEEANCRQILARARKRIEERRPRFEASSQDAEQLMQEFVRMVRSGAVEELLDHLASDVVFLSDGGGKARALPKAIYGADPVARLLVGAARKFASPAEQTRPASVNGMPGLVTFVGNRATRVMAFSIESGRIRHIFVITNPDKLRHLSRGA
ncbi:MAG TPA: RNA polymerase sigma-70 factor [Chthoniobacterales bacterium]